jgi:hypothetical protein
MPVARALLIVSLCALVAACAGTSDATRGRPVAAATPAGDACALTAAGALAGVAQRIYGEAVGSATQRADLGLVARSAALRAAVLAGDPAATAQAAQALIATGHISRIRVSAGGRVLADVGSHPALAPSKVALPGTGGQALVSIQSGRDFLAAAGQLTTSDASLSSGSRLVLGTFPGDRGAVPAAGVVRLGGADYAVASFPVRTFPSGTLRANIVRPLASTGADCGATPADTVRNTLGGAVTRIYATEAHGPAIARQAARVAGDGPLRAAVAARDPAAIRSAAMALLKQHIVRVRVQVPGLAPVDVGGPYVLGPVTVALHRGGRTIGTAQLSVQDVLGFVLLARRIVGTHVVVALPSRPPVTAAEQQLIASSSLRVGGYRVTLRDGTPPTMTTLAGAPATLPTAGPVTIGGRSYGVYSFDATAFPSGPLPVWVLVPAP